MSAQAQIQRLYTDLQELTAAEFGAVATKYHPDSAGIDLSKVKRWCFKVFADDQTVALQVEENMDRDGSNFRSLSGQAIAAASFTTNKINTIESDMPVGTVRLAMTSGATAPTATKAILMVNF